MATRLNLSTATVAMVAAATGVDTALRNGEQACNVWARYCAKRLMGDKPSLTLDDVAATLVAACLAVATPKQKKEIGTVGTLAKNGFATAYGWHRMLVRIHAANMLPQLAEAKSSLWALGKAAPSTQAPSSRKGKGKKGKGKAGANNGSADANVAETQLSPAPSASLGWKDVAAFVIAERKAGKADAKRLMDNEPAIANIIAELGNIARLMETARKAKARSKAKAKTVGTVAKAAKAKAA